MPCWVCQCDWESVGILWPSAALQPHGACVNMDDGFHLLPLCGIRNSHVVVIEQHVRERDVAVSLNIDDWQTATQFGQTGACMWASSRGT
jgi:hypothetical protein